MQHTSADFVIVGGGTAGLVLANRLSEDPSVSVLVIEGGQDKTYDEKAQDPKNWRALLGDEYCYQYTTTPQTEADGRTFDQQQGKALGGGSTINNAVWFPPSRATLDGWSKMGNSKWTYDDLLPYFQKSHTFCPPAAKDLSAVGAGQLSYTETTSGPIKVSYPAVAQQHPGLRAWNDTFGDMGYPTTSDLFSETSIGGVCFSAAQYPDTGKRSSAAIEYGVPAFQRPNVSVLTNTTAQKIIFKTTTGPLTATGVEITTSSGETTTITAHREVLLCAGAYNSPKLLELSGIGDPTLLSQHSIATLIPNSGVGANLQNHAMAGFTVPFKPTTPLGSGMHGWSFMPLHHLTNPAAQRDFFSHFPSSTQHTSTLRSLYTSSSTPLASASLFMTLIPTAKLAYFGLMTTIPFSVGSVHISSAHAQDAPAINPAFLSHGADREIMAHQLLTLLEVARSPAMADLFDAPGLDVHSVDEAREFVTKTMAPAYHPCGSAGMMPRDRGGVVGQDLKVYGTRNVRVVDASVFPLLTHANPMATVYAVAERAADIIKRGGGVGE